MTAPDATRHTVTLQTSGKRFVVAAGERILDAARRAGLARPYRCRSGRCGSCQAILRAGTCVLAHGRRRSAIAAGSTADRVLLCQAVPTSDLVIAGRDVASLADLSRRVLPLTLVTKTRLAPTVMRLVLRPPPGEPLRRLAGQYLEIRLDSGERRAFSIANAPFAGPELELHVRQVAGGDFSRRVFGALDRGEVLWAEGPRGAFVPHEDSERPLLFVAGGTGFAPIKALIEHFLALGTRRSMRLYWGARTAAELYLRGVATRWAERTPRFSFVPVSERGAADRRLRRGRVDEVVLADLPDLSGFDVYLSGPPALIEAGRLRFVAAGLPEDRLFFDSYADAPQVLARALAARAGLSEG
jgi:CDP-4-dehydro-6-deoxyglucose reductase